MGHSIKSVSPLRQRMIEDMTLRKLNSSTQIGYIRAVVKLTRYLGRSPDTATAEDLRRFQLHMVENDVSSITINTTLTGLKFFFDQTAGTSHEARALLDHEQRVDDNRHRKSDLQSDQQIAALVSKNGPPNRSKFHIYLLNRRIVVTITEFSIELPA